MQPTYRTPVSVNGTLILVLGVLSILGIPVLGPVAWILGNNGLNTIDRGSGDFQERKNVVIGRTCGIISTVILVIGVVCGIFYATFLGAILTHTRDGDSTSPATFKVSGSHAHKGHRKALPGYYDLAKALKDNDTAKVNSIARQNPAILNARNAQGETLLFQTVSDGKPAMTGLLLRLGANVNARDKTGSTPLDKARAMGRDDVLAVLVSHGGKR